MHSIAALLAHIIEAVLAVSFSGALLLYHLWHYERSNDDEGKELPGATAGPLSILPSLLGIALEALSFAVLVLTYPLRVIHDLSPFRAQARGETPILLVHGWGANSA